MACFSISHCQLLSLVFPLSFALYIASCITLVMSNDPGWSGDTTNWGEGFDPQALSYLQEIMADNENATSQADIYSSAEVFSVQTSSNATETFVSDGFQRRLDETQSGSQRTLTIAQVRIYLRLTSSLTCSIICYQVLQSQVPVTPDPPVSITVPPVSTTVPPVATTAPIAATTVLAPDPLNVQLTNMLSSAIHFCTQTVMLSMWAGILGALFTASDIIYSNEATRAVTNYSQRIPLGTYYDFVFDRVVVQVSHLSFLCL